MDTDFWVLFRRPLISPFTQRITNAVPLRGGFYLAPEMDVVEYEAKVREHRKHQILHRILVVPYEREANEAFIAASHCCLFQLLDLYKQAPDWVFADKFMSSILEKNPELLEWGFIRGVSKMTKLALGEGDPTRFHVERWNQDPGVTSS